MGDYWWVRGLTSPGSTPNRDRPIAETAGQETAWEKDEIAVVLPTLNEKSNLRRTYESIPLGALSRRGGSVRTFVIDGGSTDGTLEEAEALGLPVLHQKSRGKGAAIREAMDYLVQRGSRYAIVMDADCTYPGEAIVSVLSLLKSGAELVVGVRQNRRPPKNLKEIVHRAGNAALTYVASQLSSHLVLDLCSGFWGVDLRQWSDDGFVATGFEIESELFLKSLRSGLSVTQIPIAYRARAKGAKLRTVHDGARIFLSVLRSARWPMRTHLVHRPTEGTLIRSMLSACFIQGADRIVLLSDVARLSQAQLLREQLSAGGIETTLVVADGPVPADSTRLLASMVQQAGASQAPVLALSRGTPTDSPDRESGVVVLPNTRRIIALGLTGATSNAGATRPALGDAAPSPPGAVSGGFTMVSQRAKRPPGSAIRSLRSVLDPSLVEQKLLMLRANPIGMPVSVWKPTGPVSRPAIIDRDERG